MCGIVGIVERDGTESAREEQLRQMLALIRHRGPDQFGIYLDERAGLGNARLSIIDLSHGQQPIANEDETLWIVFNGEIFNYVELRPELEARGHRFRTQTDTEVILHAYEEYGPDCLNRFNGQWAFALWDTRRQELFLARDRLGVRPLFYTRAEGAFLFGSEIKTLLADRRVSAELDPAALDQVFTFWAPLSPRTVFRDIVELPPGSYLRLRGGEVRVRRYWQLRWPDAAGASARSTADYLDEFRELLVDAARIRLRADVPVGAYLSGGLDSSVTAAIIRRHAQTRLDTFSIAFSDPQFDESGFQREMARFLGTEHQVVHATHADIGRVFPELIWHTEVPLMRTAPAPMFLLSQLVRDRRYKVVLTGEGADEFLGGYDIFKEAKVRRWWARQPDSTWRHGLLKRLYPDIANFSRQQASMLAAFFRDGLGEVDSPYYSHAIRWKNTGRARRFFSDSLAARIREGWKAGRELPPVPPDFLDWGPLERGQFLEVETFLSAYLLSSQGDRPAMAHSVEGRYPFLDSRVVEFCTRLPSRLKVRGLREKHLLRLLGRELLPAEIWQRRKRPYRAPIHRSFFGPHTPDYVRDLLAPSALAAAGHFKPAGVGQLVRRIEQGGALGETDDMALAGIISTQLLQAQFIDRFRLPPPLDERDDVKVCVGSSAIAIH